MLNGTYERYCTLAAATAKPVEVLLTKRTVTAASPVNVAAAAPANAATTAATTTTAVADTTTAALPDKVPVAKVLHMPDAEQGVSPAASVQACQIPLTSAHAVRQQRPRLLFDPISTATRLSGSSSPTSSQHVAAGKHTAHSLARETMVMHEAVTPMTAGGVTPFCAMTPHPLQLRTVAVPFWGLPPPAPLAATNDNAMISAITTTAAATATKLPPTNSTATPFATATAAAIPIEIQASSSTAAPLGKPPTAELFHTAGAEQATAPAVSIQPREEHRPDSYAERQQRRPLFCDATSSASSLAPTSANSSTFGSQQIVADKHDMDSLPRQAIADIPGAAVGKKAQPRGSRRATASAAAPTASKMVTRSQAAAQKHVQRMRMHTQYQKRQ